MKHLSRVLISACVLCSVGYSQACKSCTTTPQVERREPTTGNYALDVALSILGVIALVVCIGWSLKDTYVEH